MNRAWIIKLILRSGLYLIMLTPFVTAIGPLVPALTVGLLLVTAWPRPSAALVLVVGCLLNLHGPVPALTPAGAPCVSLASERLLQPAGTNWFQNHCSWFGQNLMSSSDQNLRPVL